MAKRRILVIDDEAAFVSLLKLNLEHFGEYEVRTECRGGRGLEAARLFHPDLILLDVIMPDVSGTEVAAQLKADEQVHDVPIVFLTAAVSQSESAAGGPDGSITMAKPVTMPDLLACIEQRLKAPGAGGQRRRIGRSESADSDEKKEAGA